MHFSLMQTSKVKWSYNRGEQDVLTLQIVWFDLYKRIIVWITELKLFGWVEGEWNAMYYSRVTKESTDLDFIHEARKGLTHRVKD